MGRQITITLDDGADEKLMQMLDGFHDKANDVINRLILNEKPLFKKSIPIEIEEKTAATLRDFGAFDDNYDTIINKMISDQVKMKNELFELKQHK